MNILVLILISCCLLMGFFMMIPAQPHNNIILENTLPKDKLYDPLVKKVTQAYKKSILLIMGLCCLLGLLLILVPYESIFMTGFFILVFGNIAAGYFCEIYYIRQLRRVIVENHWELQTDSILIDTKILEDKNRKMVPFGWLIGSLILTLIFAGYLVGTFEFTGTAWLFCSVGILLWGVFAISYYYISRLPVKAWSNETSLNQQYNDLTKYYWSLSMVSMSYFFAPITILPNLITSTSPNIGMILNVVFFLLLIFGCVFSIGCLFRLRNKQDQLINQVPDQRYTGDDQYWRYAFYYNPQDARLMIPDRIGMNISINLGKPAAKVIAGVLGIFVIAVLWMSTIPMFHYDFNPNAFHMEIDSATVVMKAPMVKTSDISLADIQKVELINELPDRTVRVYGMGTSHYFTGSFKVAGKTATMYVNRKRKPILRVVTAKKDYYFTSNRKNGTKKYYQEIKNLIDN